ncbi:MAG: OmpA family protein [Phycisphaerales bacterium]
MARIPLFGLAAFALCAALAGCNDNNKNGSAALVEDNDTLAKQLDTQNARLNELGAQLQREKTRADDLAAQLAACQETAAVPGPAGDGAGTVSVKGWDNIPGVEASVVNGDLHLAIASNLLFDSGKTSLKDSSKRSLDQVATKVKEAFPNREILVVGHTDGDPIRKSSFASNYHLGFERAFQVRAYLEKKGLAGSQMALASYGPDQPKGSKDASRRVEIVVTRSEALAGSVKSETPKNAASHADKSKATVKKSAAKTATPAKSTSSKKTSTPGK